MVRTSSQLLLRHSSSSAWVEDTSHSHDRRSCEPNEDPSNHKVKQSNRTTIDKVPPTGNVSQKQASCKKVSKDQKSSWKKKPSFSLLTAVENQQPKSQEQSQSQSNRVIPDKEDSRQPSPGIACAMSISSSNESDNGNDRRRRNNSHSESSSATTTTTNTNTPSPPSFVVETRTTPSQKQHVSDCPSWSYHGPRLQEQVSSLIASSRSSSSHREPRQETTASVVGCASEKSPSQETFWRHNHDQNNYKHTYTNNQDEHKNNSCLSRPNHIDHPNHNSLDRDENPSTVPTVSSRTSSPGVPHWLGRTHTLQHQGSHRGLSKTAPASSNHSVAIPSTVLTSGDSHRHRPTCNNIIDLHYIQSQLDNPLVTTPNTTFCSTSSSSSTSTCCSTKSTPNHSPTTSIHPTTTNTKITNHNSSYNRRSASSSCFDHHSTLEVRHHQQQQQPHYAEDLPLCSSYPSCGTNSSNLAVTNTVAPPEKNITKVLDNNIILPKAPPTQLEIPDLEVALASCLETSHHRDCNQSCASSFRLSENSTGNPIPPPPPFSTVRTNMVNSNHSHHRGELGSGSAVSVAGQDDKTPLASNKVMSHMSSSSLLYKHQRQQPAQAPAQPYMASSTSWQSMSANAQKSVGSSLFLQPQQSQQAQYYHPESSSSILEQRQEPSPFSSPASSSAQLVAPSFLPGSVSAPLTNYRAAVGSTSVPRQSPTPSHANCIMTANLRRPDVSSSSGAPMTYAAKMQMSMPLSMAPSHAPPPRPSSSSVTTSQQSQFHSPSLSAMSEGSIGSGVAGASSVGARSRSGSGSRLMLSSEQHRSSGGAIGGLSQQQSYRMTLSPNSHNASTSVNRSSAWQHSSGVGHTSNTNHHGHGPPSSTSMSFRNALHSSGKQHAVPNSPGHHSRSHHHSSSTRPAPEVLKTLLRKKACLYEPGTSRAIALITWLVGRNLALKLGYFSRQRLQAGVHAVVANKIDTGMITRTKVNRCMQIILNSCFHYIIPRPDGMEENGEAFRKVFAQTVEDDTHLLKSLLPPWDDLDITVADNMVYCDEEDEDTEQDENKTKAADSSKSSSSNVSKSFTDTTKQGKENDSRKLKQGSKKQEEDDMSSTAHQGSDHSQSKRLVLLCFNENVRSAEDVLRCHNDFIRDAAISSSLFLTSDEWKYFFSRKDDDGSQTTATVDSTTSGSAGIYSSPMVRGTEGCDIPYLSFDIPPEVTDCLAFQDSISEPWGKSSDVLGQMNSNELSKFRTTWCCKRYDHDIKLCRFAHVAENKGWLRRDPTLYHYVDQLCPHTAIVKSDDSILKGCHVNACKEGVKCKFAHSQEELDYHPRRYKSKVCDSCKGGNNLCRPCPMLDICPNSHPNPSGNHRLGRRRGDSFSRNGKGTLKLNTITDADDGDDHGVPGGSPIIYLSPAPFCEFDKAFQFAGLQSLFRRNCTVHYASHCGIKGTKYTLFSNDCGIQDPLFRPGRGNESFSLYSE